MNDFDLETLPYLWIRSSQNVSITEFPAYPKKINVEVRVDHPPSIILGHVVAGRHAARVQLIQTGVETANNNIEETE